MWLFSVPLLIFIYAYWKIFVVVRRQAKLEAERRKVTKKSNEPVAGTSRGKTEMTRVGITNANGENGLDNKDVESKATLRGKGRGKQGMNVLSEAKINVMKTMIYIVVCFALCWMPRATYSVYKKLTVT